MGGVNYNFPRWIMINCGLLNMSWQIVEWHRLDDHRSNLVTSVSTICLFPHLSVAFLQGFDESPRHVGEVAHKSKIGPAAKRNILEIHHISRRNAASFSWFSQEIAAQAMPGVYSTSCWLGVHRFGLGPPGDVGKKRHQKSGRTECEWTRITFVS